MHIQKLTPNDLHTLRFISEYLIDGENKPSFEHLNRLLEDDRTYIFAAIDDETVIGYALAYRFPSLYETTHHAYLYDIEVVEAFRKKGAGRMLIDSVREHLKTDGVSELWLGTAVDNAGGQALFSSTGAVRSSEAFNDFTYSLGS
jgi:ribosomal protein S18 acetylase RimI-like enzyme